MTAEKIRELKLVVKAGSVQDIHQGQYVFCGKKNPNPLQFNRALNEDDLKLISNGKFSGELLLVEDIRELKLETPNTVFKRVSES